MKNLLFVGDLRTGGNYGAVATTQCLLDLIEENLIDFDITRIEGRSFHKETPPDGWSDTDKLVEYYSTPHEEYAKIKTTIRRVLIKYYSSFLGRRKTVNVEDYLPKTINEFESYKERVLNNEILIYEKKKIEQADLIVINAEGAIVNGTNEEGVYRRGGRYVLFFAYLAKIVFKKKVCIINHIVEPMNADIDEIIKKIYPELDLVIVRDKASLKKLNSLGICNAKYLPDALFSYRNQSNVFVRPCSIRNDFDFDKPFVCLGDSTGFVNSYQKVKWDIEIVYDKLVDALVAKFGQVLIVDGFNGNNESINRLIKRKKLSYVRLGTCPFPTLFQIFKKASIYISGRWHTSILSLCAHTPILCWGADSNKTLSLYKDMGYNYKFFDIDTIPSCILDIIEESYNIVQSDLSLYWQRVDKMNSDSKDVIKYLKSISNN